MRGRQARTVPGRVSRKGLPVSWASGERLTGVPTLPPVRSQGRLVWLWGHGRPCCPGVKPPVSANASVSQATVSRRVTGWAGHSPGGAGWSTARHAAAWAGMGRGWPGPGGLGLGRSCETSPGLLGPSSGLSCPRRKTPMQGKDPDARKD